MKKNILLIALIITCAFCSCSSNDKTREKALMKQIMDKHDTVMAKTEKIVKYRLTLDSIGKTAKDTLEIHALKSQLIMADEAMETWMHKFDPDFTGKSGKEVETYLQTQKKQIGRVDSLITLSLNKADKFLNKK